MDVDFTNTPDNVLFTWRMPMPPRIGEEVCGTDGNTFTVTNVEYIEHKGYEQNVDCGAICSIRLRIG